MALIPLYFIQLFSIPILILAILSMLISLRSNWCGSTKAWKYWNWINKSNPRLAFHDVAPLPDFNVASTMPRAYRPWKAGKYNMTMGIRKMPEEDWL